MPKYLPICVGAVLRLIWVAVHPHILVWDEIAYHELAAGLARGDAYANLFWPPGWPMVLSLLYRTVGVDATAAIWFNVVSSMISIVLVGELAQRVFGEREAHWARWMMAVMPSYILAPVIVLYDVWFQLLLLLGCWFAFRPIWSLAQLVAIVCITVLLTLLRPFWLVLPLLLWGVARLLYGRSTLRVRWLAVAQAAAVLLVGVWVSSASLQAGVFVPVALNGGMNLWIGNNPKATGYYMVPPGEFWNAAYDGVARQQALDYISENPGRTLGLLPRKLISMFSGEPWSIWIFGNTAAPVAPATVMIFTYVSNATYGVVLIAAALGVGSLIRQRAWQQLAPLLILLYNILCYLPFFGGLRFRWQVQCFLILYAAAFGASKWLSTRRQTQQPPISERDRRLIA